MPLSASRVIFHLDFDAFYASVEERENPSLKGKPLIIGADPKEGSGRGVVVACSYAARKKGLHSGQPISRAFRLCPEGTYLRPNFELYESVSRNLMHYLKPFADKFEQLSIDEACMDVTQSNLRHGGPVELGKFIKAQVMANHGLTCSIGIAPNKSAAKIAADYQKPDGLTYVPPDHVKEFLAPLPVSKISGIGKKTEPKLNELGIRTIGDLANYPPKKLVEEFGRNAIWMWAIANAQEQVPVQETYEMKSIGAESTFESDTDNWQEVDEELRSLIQNVHTRLTDEQFKFRTVTLKIRFTGFETYTRAKSARFPSANREVIARAINDLIEEFRDNKKKVRLVGVRLSGFSGKSVNAKVEKTLDSFATSTR